MDEWRRRERWSREEERFIVDYTHRAWPYPIREIGTDDYRTWVRVYGEPVEVHAGSLRDAQQTVKRLKENDYEKINPNDVRIALGVLVGRVR